MKLQPLRPLLPLGFAALLLGAFVTGTQDGALETRSVAGGISYLVGPGGNVGVSVGDDGVLLIDDKFEQSSRAIEAAVRALSPVTPSFLVNTHWHGDHTGGNAFWGEKLTILAHTNVRRRLAGDPQIDGRKNEPGPAAALPVITYDDGASIHFNGEEIRLIHVPDAHTDGDTVVWFTGSNVVHMGDLFFQLGYPFIDVGSGGSAQGLIAGVKHVLDTVPEDCHVIPGHGDATDVAGLREYLTMLETIVRRVDEGMHAGKTAQELVDDGVTREFDARWGQFNFVPPARFVEAIVQSLGE